MKRYMFGIAVLLAMCLLGTAWSDPWTSLAPTPTWQYLGSALVFGQPNELYAIFGTTKRLDRYYISGNYWDAGPADFPGDVNFGPGAALTSDGSNIIYVLVGGVRDSSGATGFLTTPGCGTKTSRLMSTPAVHWPMPR
ncbi:MAG: hypothetical protein ABIK44_02190 [candidate division WOR-3 bacterium]